MIETRAQIKTYFETGDTPTEAQFINAWDSTVFKVSGAGAPASTPEAVGDTYIDTTNDDIYIAVDTTAASDWKKLTQSTALEAIIITCSDLTSDLAVGTGVESFRMPYAFTLVAVRASAYDAPTGGTLLTVDINESGTTILSTKLTFDASEKTTTTATTPAVISDSSLADDAEITIDIDAVGSTNAGKGLKVYLIGYKS